MLSSEHFHVFQELLVHIFSGYELEKQRHSLRGVMKETLMGKAYFIIETRKREKSWE